MYEKLQIESVKLWLTYESYKYESYLIRKPILVSASSWKDYLGLTTWWCSRANWKKYIISLYSATTWVDRFDFFTEYRLRHVWLIYDVICHDSYLMSHKIPNFSISQVFWRLYVIGKQKKGKQIQIHFSLLWLIIWVIHIWVIPSFEANSMIYYQVEEKLEIDHLMGLERRSRKIYETAL